MDTHSPQEAPNIEDAASPPFQAGSIQSPLDAESGQLTSSDKFISAAKPQASRKPSLNTNSSEESEASSSAASGTGAVSSPASSIGGAAESPLFKPDNTRINSSGRSQLLHPPSRGVGSTDNGQTSVTPTQALQTGPDAIPRPSDHAHLQSPRSARTSGFPFPMTSLPEEDGTAHSSKSPFAPAKNGPVDGSVEKEMTSPGSHNDAGASDKLQRKLLGSALDPWSHHDDLLGPVNSTQSNPHNTSQADSTAHAASVSSYLRNSLGQSQNASHASTQAGSAVASPSYTFGTARSGSSAASTYSANASPLSKNLKDLPSIAASVNMDRRGSGSSISSSSATSPLGEGSALPDLPSSSTIIKPVSSSSLSNMAAKFVPASASQPVSGQTSSVTSPLSPHVEPFSPSMQPNSLPSRTAGASLPLAYQRSTRSQSLSTTSPSGTPPAGQRGLQEERTILGNAPASADGAANYAIYGAGGQFRPSGHRESSYEEQASIAAARQRAWSETGILGIVPSASRQPSAVNSYLQQRRDSYLGQPDTISEEPSSYHSGNSRGYYSNPPSADVSGSAGYAYQQRQPPSHVMASRRSMEFEYARNYPYSLASGPPSVSDVSTAGSEEITTIFVVGFPEDIQEREFQNMFMFAKGFEAATLKIPASTAAARERDAAAAAAVSAIAATLPAYNNAPSAPPLETPYGSAPSSSGTSSYDHLNNSLYEESYQASIAAAQSGSVPAAQAESAHRVSHALAAAAITASASTAGLINQTNRKQIIGFAKFRTREDALEARDVISGRKIDSEKGSLLKAEIAKKNLHTKKTVSELSMGEVYPPALSSKSSLTALDRLAERELLRSRQMSLPSGTDGLSGDFNATSQPASAFEAFHSVSDDAAAQTGLQNIYGRTDRDASNASLRQSQQAYIAGLQQHAGQAMEAATDSVVSPRHRSTTGTSNFGKALLQELDDGDDLDFPLGNPTTGFGASAYNGRGDSSTTRRQPPPALPSSILDSAIARHALPGPASATSPLSSAYSQAQLPFAATPTSASSVRHFDRSQVSNTDLVSPTYANFALARGPNRADDNAPISTLYVGGLPSVLPNLTSQVSASLLEDALRAVFSKCQGFKRLSFRQKSQGPMCFIEFEDVTSAARTMSEMYGHTLGGLVKGGIRLAYSKNPLGVRGLGGSSGPGSPTPLSPSYFASDAAYISYHALATASTPTLASRGSHESVPLYNPASQASTGYANATSPSASAYNAYSNRPHPTHHTSGHNVSEAYRYAANTHSPSSAGPTSFSPFALER